MSDQSPNVKAVFGKALEIDSREAQAAYLDEACGDDTQLRREVEDLLQASAQAGSFMAHPVMEPQATLDQRITEKPATRIGHYKLIEQIGEGGMGTVWMAQQTEPVKRVVAIKLIKSGLDSRQVIARFEAERQALALMDHPNIAKVLDAGTVGMKDDGRRMKDEKDSDSSFIPHPSSFGEAGRPYFVMELVKGVPITRYCDEHHLTPRQRLELFVPVCQAVQHAHQKGIIHRDLKPSNVLVALYDDKPVPKIIDFGIAKATGQQLTEHTLNTGFGAVVGTLEYMSPEQAGFNQLDIDTRSDIYSLGVLLYELLAGSPPFTRKELEKAGMLEMLRVIREQEPSTPSTKLSSSNSLPSLSANRGTEPAKLTKLVRGELDWIVMRALEKDRSRRYETANNLAADLQRYLSDEPVLACPPSVGYRFRKFARRHKGGLAVAVLVLFFLVLLGSGAGWALRDRAARQSRIGAQVDLILGEVDQLEKEQKWAEALAVARRAEALTADAADAATEERVRQVLHDLQMVAGLEELRLQEEVGAEAGAKVDEGRPRLYAAAFRDFGVDVETLPAEESAARLRAQPAVAIALAAALDDWARTRRPRATDESKRLWALAAAVDPDPWRVSVRQASAAIDVEALMKLANAPDTARQPPQSQLLLASSLRLCDQPDQALALLVRACEMHPGDFSIHFDLAWLNSKVRPARLEAAVRHGIAARALRPQSAVAWNNLGGFLRQMGNPDEAIACYRKAIDLNPNYTLAHNNLGVALYTQENLDEAVVAYRKAIELDPNYATAQSNLGLALRVGKKLDEAIACCRKAIALDPQFAVAHVNLGLTLRDQQKLDEAIACYRKAIALDPKDALAHDALGIALYDQKKLDEAIACFTKAIALDPRFANAHSNLGLVLRDQKKLDEAIACYRKAIELDPKLAAAHFNLGNALHEQQKLDEAIACYRKAIELVPKDAEAHSNLGNVLRDQKKLDEAIAYYRKAIELDPKLAAAHFNLGNALHEQQKLDEAIACYRKAIELDPKYAPAHSNLGNVLRGQNRPGEAIAAYRQAIELDPKHAPAHYNLGIALTQQNDLPGAIGAFGEAVRLEPANIQYLCSLGHARRDAGQLDEAIAVYREAVHSGPRYPQCHQILVEALQKAGKSDLVVAALREWVRAIPADASAQNRLLDALRTQGKLDDAIAEVRQAVTLQKKMAAAAAPQLTQYQFRLAELLNDRAWQLVSGSDLTSRDPKQAIDLAQEAASLAPKLPWLEKSLGVAHYRAGNWNAAALALEKLRQLNPHYRSDSVILFFLSMAQWQLNEKEQARAFFDQAVQWRMGIGATEEELRRLCAEAAALLGLEVPPTLKEPSVLTPGPNPLKPAAGAALDNGAADGGKSYTWEFNWSGVPGATRYHLYVIGPTAKGPLINNPVLTSTSYRFEAKGNVAHNVGWRWKVRAFANGVWSDWSEERAFDVAAVGETKAPSPKK